MTQQIREVSMNAIDPNHPLVDYADGDIVIIDNARQLTQIESMKMGMNFIILCCAGKIQFELNGRLMLLKPGEVLFSSPNVILDNYMFSPDFECKILCLSDRIIQGLLHDEIAIWNQAVYVRQMNIVRLPESDRQQFEYYHALICSKLNENGRLFQRDIMQSVVRALLLELCSVLGDASDQKELQEVSRGKVLFNEFLNLIASKKVKRQSVGKYAYELAITPKYLSMLCEKYSDKTASKWIEQYANEDIRYYLKNTGLSVKEVADRMGFCTISHFGAYVRRNFGMSPRAFRIQSRKEK